ncbi:MAG: hypothetical protein GKR88_05875 [Flavobacteriaceae bacterium]|nr:MAG: hypothetical protein GKR88_05875 [Flavobacteriaceae bacterium]
MKKTLGLDLGTASIGWAFIHEAENDQETSKIIKTGVRIVPLTKEEKDEFSKGNALSTNLSRTQKRGARRNNQRFKQRRDKLISILKDIGFIKNTNDLLSTNSLDLYQNRAMAATSKIEKKELAKVLFLLNGKRGFKSNRKANSEATDSNYLAGITERDQELSDRGITVGQKLYELLRINPLARLRGRIYSRSSYLNEFETIWKEQAKHYPELTESLKEIIRDTIIFYQRDLKSQKGLLSECEFEKNHKVIPVSSPLFQEFRIWQRLHDIDIKDRSSNKHILTHEQKKVLFDKLQEVPKMTSTQILRALGLNTKEYSINFDKIDGNTTRFELVSIFNRLGYDTLDVLDLDIYQKGNDFDKQPVMQLWHLIYSAKSNENLIKNLKLKFAFNEEQASEIVSKINYTLRYGSLSSRAIRKILPHMERGLNYSDACKEAGYNHSKALTKEENESRIL